MTLISSKIKMNVIIRYVNYKHMYNQIKIPQGLNFYVDTQGFLFWWENVVALLIN